MKSTGRWAKVTDQDGLGIGVRMLHEDRRGRLCVRYQRQWRLVVEKREDGLEWMVETPLVELESD